jgi:hypothetical protein
VLARAPGRYCSGERRYSLQQEVGLLHPLQTPRVHPGGRKGLNYSQCGLNTRGCSMPGTGITHLHPVAPLMVGQRSVTLFSSAAAICCRRKASCIF